MNGEARPFAALRRGARLFVTLALRGFFAAFSLPRSLSSYISRLHSDYFFCTRHVPIPVEVGFLGRSAPRQDNGVAG